MIRLLIIGRDAEDWYGELERWRGRSIEVSAEGLPGAGIRNFSESTPDAVAIAEPADSGRIAPIAEAVRERPLGDVVPIVTLGAAPGEDSELEIAASIERAADAERLVECLEELLDVSLGLAPAGRDHGAAESKGAIEVETAPEGKEPTHHSTEIPTMREGAATREEVPEEVEADGGVEHRDYVIERIDRAPDAAREEGGDEESVSAAGVEAIRRKIEEVRHEDYFTVLELPRSSDGARVREAYRRLKTRFAPERIDLEASEAYAEELAEIHDALDDARAVLGDDALRAAYVAGSSTSG